MSQTSLAAQQANSIGAQLKKQSEKLRVAGEAVQTFQEKLAALLGNAAGFGAPAEAAEPTLMQVNGNASTLYSQIWQVDATPTSAQLAAITAAEHDSAAVMKRWAAFKKEALPELNRKLHEANLPEIEIASVVSQHSGFFAPSRQASLQHERKLCDAAARRLDGAAYSVRVASEHDRNEDGGPCQLLLGGHADRERRKVRRK